MHPQLNPPNPLVPPPAGNNFITGVLDNGDGTYVITLARPIGHAEVTTLTYRSESGDTEITGTFKFHPADVNGDGTSSAVDILALIDCLNHVSECSIERCDIDRSDVCAPADILRLIDLLNGADDYEPWLGVRLQDPSSCP